MPRIEHPNPTGANAHRSLHGHMWIMGAVGVVIGLAIAIHAPHLRAVSNSLFLFAGFHLVGGAIALASLYIVALRPFMRKLFRGARRAKDTYDFGWGPGWMNGLAIAAAIALSCAVLIELGAPAYWPAAIALAGLAMLFIVGNAVMSGFRRLDHAVLPMVDLMRRDDARVLDAGCGSGRTIIALKRGLGNARIIALDRFDAGYIDDGGRALLERNVARAGLSDRVEIVTGDLTAMPLHDESVDAAVSTNVFDHLGAGKQLALAEIFRVLRPGGRFLLAVWVPGLSTFAIGNLLCLFLTSKKRWREMAGAEGFKVIDEGVFNHAWFAVLEKPAAQ